MATTTLRKIVHIDESKCNGCGVCIPNCAEGALKIIDGKAKLVSEKFCDGLGACLGKCPEDAIRVEERVAEDFDEIAVEHYLAAKHQDTPSFSCPSTAHREFVTITEAPKTAPAPQKSSLSHWPVQLTLVSPGAPFLNGADVVLAAHCTAFAQGDFHDRFLTRHSLLIACPKLDDFEAHQAKLTEVLKRSNIKSLTVVHMEVPCCSGLSFMAREAVKASGKTIPVKDVTVSVRGQVLRES